MKSAIKLSALLLLLCGCSELGMQEEAAITATFPQVTIPTLSNEVSIPIELSDAATSAVQLQLEVVNELNLEQGTDYHLLSNTVTIDKNSRTGSFTLLLDSEKAKQGNQQQSVEFRLTSSSNINTGDARCTVSWQEVGSGVSIAFATTTQRCLENSGKLLLPLKIVGKVERPFTAIVTSADEKVRQLLNLPVSVTIPAGSQEVRAEIAVTDNSVIDPDHLCTLQLQTPPSVEVPMEGSVCEVNIINDDSSIGFLSDEFVITYSLTDVFLIPIKLSGYQPDNVRVKVELTTAEQEQTIELVEDEVVINVETQTGYVKVRQLSYTIFKDLMYTLTIKEAPQQISVTNRQINLHDVSEVNQFTGDWKLFAPIYIDLKGTKLNHYIPVKITLQHPLNNVTEEDLTKVTYECRFNISKNKIARFYIDANLNTEMASFNFNNNYYIFDNDGHKTDELLMYDVTPKKDITINIVPSITYIPFEVGESKIELYTFRENNEEVVNWVFTIQTDIMNKMALVRDDINN